MLLSAIVPLVSLATKPVEFDMDIALPSRKSATDREIGSRGARGRPGGNRAACVKGARKPHSTNDGFEMLATRTKREASAKPYNGSQSFPNARHSGERTNHLHTSRQRFTRKRTAFRRTHHMEPLCRELRRAALCRYRSRPSHAHEFVRGRNA